MSPEWLARLDYERCLHSLFSTNLPELRNQIKEWPINPSLPLWEAKRAGLLAELGDLEQAEKILERALSFIRAQLNLSPVSNDYSWVSQEAIVMQLFQYIKRGKSLSAGLFEQSAEILERLAERWNDLKRYKCDPWGETKLFEAYLEREAAPFSPVRRKSDFDIGQVTITTTHYNGIADKEAFTAYSFLRYHEDAGIPFRIPQVTFAKKAAEGALKRISTYSPYWASATLIRIGDSKVVDTIFDRQSISRMSVQDIELLIDHYLEVMKSVLSDTRDGSPKTAPNSFAAVLANVVPEILSRLCVKCSDATGRDILECVKSLYYSAQKRNFGDSVAHLARRLIASFSNNALRHLLKDLLEFPILSDAGFIIENYFPEPFQYVQIDTEFYDKCERSEISDTVIDDLIRYTDTAGEGRRRACLRLAKLHELGLLTEMQTSKFSTAIWAQRDEPSGFPKDTGLYKFAFLRLPYPSDVDPTELFQEFVLHAEFPIESARNDQAVTITGGRISLCEEILGGSRTPFSETGIEWSHDQATIIFDKLLEWWDGDKHYLTDDAHHLFSSRSDEFQSRFEHLVEITAYVVAPRLDRGRNTLSKLDRLLHELAEYGIPSLRIWVASFHILPDKKQEVYDAIADEIRLCRLFQVRR